MRTVYPLKKLLLPCLLMGTWQIGLGQNLASAGTLAGKQETVLASLGLRDANPSGVLAIQSQTVTGKIVDKTGQGLPGVTIMLKGTTKGTATDVNGSFSLSVPDGKGILVVSFVGYTTQEVPINNRSSINITMAPDAKALEEVVVVGYGTQTKANVTSSIQTLDAKELSDIPVTQFSQKLQGKLAGVQIQQTTGKPGQGMAIRIRGAASVRAGSEPLYVVDGFPIVGGINNINPDEIETFTVLKDASATSLYGSRGANGVVLIQTKRAKEGQTNISFNSFVGFQEVPEKGRPDLMNAREFAQFQKEIREEQAARTGKTVAIPAEYQNPEQYGEGTDWYDILLRKAKMENYSLTIATNKDKFSSSVVAGYINQDGVMINTGYKRLSLRLNTDYQINDKINVGFNVAPTHAISKSPNSDGSLWSRGILESAILTSPTAVAVNPDGSLPLTANAPGLFPNPNWYRVAQELKNEDRSTRMLANAFVNAEIIKDLKFKSTINVDWGNAKTEYFRPSTSGHIFAPPPQRTEASLANSNFYSWLTENTLNYSKTIGDHGFEALVGYTAQRYRGDNSSITAIDFPDDNVETLNAAATTRGTSDIQEWGLLSWLGRVNYNYKGKYLLSAAMRRDGSSRFGPDNRWGNFPSVSAGWNVSDENFMADLPAVSYLKVRASYGLTGNNNIGNYTYFAGVTNANYVFGSVLANGKRVSSLSNSMLGWEKTSQFDFGADLGLFNNRIFLTYDYFNKYTSDMLYPIAVSRGSGFSDIMTNIGEFKFWGHELALTTRNLVGELKWSSDFNITFVKNKVMKLGTEGAPIGGLTGNPHVTRVGEPIGQFIGYVFDGIYMNQQDLDNSPKHASSNVGTVKMRDTNADGVIDDADRTIIGNPNPDFIFGFTNNFSYKKIDLNIIMSGSYGNDIMNRTYEAVQNLDGVFNVTRDIANRWRSPENPGDGVHPRVGVGTPLARAINSRWVSDGSHATIKNITLGYTLPLPNSKYIRSMRVYGSVQQAYVFTNYPGGNPEVSSNGDNALGQGVDWSAYPVPRTFTLGVNTNF